MTTTRAPSKIIPRAFPGISPGEVAELINNSQLKNFPPDTVLCRENEVEDTFYLILEGEVEVTKVINNSEKRLLKSLGAGDFFGEMALIHNAPRAATVRTVTPLIALEINKESFDRVLHNSPSISLAMVHEISRRLRENDEMAIDDLRLRASELAEAYQKMAEMEAARRDFLTNVSHQLRTPLMAAGGYLQMLQKGALPAEKIPEAIETVTRNVQQITSLVNDILFVQEMELILEKFEPVSLVDLARHVVARYDEKAQARKLKLRVKPDLFLPAVMGDAQSLERALVSLVDNAVKFSPDGGEVEIRLRRKGEQVAVSVKDQGIGIPPETLPRIFDRFYHLDKSGDQLFEGLGIGLAITKQVLSQHFGRLEVESAPGKGSTFTMWLNVGKEDGKPRESGTTI
ncbi:MAG: cyclic nucleotide-binding domain-containing protein [Chloroflexi bacterium]|nr:cyclic nucleotide-binding domain-containing protein [Chloroflexota bacterium]